MRQLHNDDAEKGILASVLLVGEPALDQALVDPSEFFNMRHRAIFSAMQELRAEGRPPGDVQLLCDALGSRLEACGGLDYLVGLLERRFVTDHVANYAQLVRRAAMTRNVLATLAELQSSDLEGVELLGRVLESVSTLARGIDDAAVTIGEAVREAYTALTAALDRKEETGSATWGIPTGFSQLDLILGGIPREVVTIIAGRPSHGKSALARSIADNANLLSADCGVHVFTPEDSRKTYALRQISDVGRISLAQMRGLRIDRAMLAKISRAAGEIYPRTGWLIDDTSGIGSAEIAMRVRKHKRENRTGLVIVDYMQLLRERGVPLYDKTTQVAVAAENLQELARTEKVAVIGVSQLNRDCEKRDDKRPILSDLRQAGELEQIADNVVFVYRDEVYDRDTDEKGITELLIRKNKNGPTGRVKLAFDEETATHRELSSRSAPPDMAQPQTSLPMNPETEPPF